MSSLGDPKNTDIENLVNDYDQFSSFVYTPISQVINEFNQRTSNDSLIRKISEFLEGDIPKPFEWGNRATMFRQLFTPNYELRYFLNIVDAVGLTPMLMEYQEDTFAPQNPLKHCLGKIPFREGKEGGRGMHIQGKNIIDFNHSDGKKISEIKTLWKQPLVEFHHELLQLYDSEANKFLFDASYWFNKNGPGAKKYYRKYIALFVHHSILFENFLLEGDELSFVKEIFLPSFIEVWKYTGEKPIIVRLLPVDMESDVFWMSHPFKTMRYIEDNKPNEDA